MPPEIADSDEEFDFDEDVSPAKVLPGLFVSNQIPKIEKIRSDIQTDDPVNIDFGQFMRSSLSHTHSPDSRYTFNDTNSYRCSTTNGSAVSDHHKSTAEVAATETCKVPATMKTKKRSLSMTRSPSKDTDREAITPDKRHRSQSPQSTSSSKRRREASHVVTDQNQTNASFSLEEHREELRHAPNTARQPDKNAIHQVSTSKASMGGFESITLDFRGSGQSLDANTNPFGPLSQISLDGEEEIPDSERLDIFFRKHDVRHEGTSLAASSDSEPNSQSRKSAKGKSKKSKVKSNETVSTERKLKQDDQEATESASQNEVAEEASIEIPTEIYNPRSTKSRSEQLVKDEPEEAEINQLETDCIELKTETPNAKPSDKPEQSTKKKRGRKAKVRDVEPLKQSAHKDSEAEESTFRNDEDQNNVTAEKQQEPKPSTLPDMPDPTKQQAETTKIETQSTHPSDEPKPDHPPAPKKRGRKPKKPAKLPDEPSTTIPEDRTDPIIEKLPDGTTKQPESKLVTAAAPPDQTFPKEDDVITEPDVNPPPATSSTPKSTSRYRVGLSRTHAIPSLLRKVNKDKETARIEKQKLADLNKKKKKGNEGDEKENEKSSDVYEDDDEKGSKPNSYLRDERGNLVEWND